MKVLLGYWGGLEGLEEDARFVEGHVFSTLKVCAV
jgi:hypothetical protein